MNTWTLIRKGKTPKLNKPVMIEGLPGIGNVGKVAVDFLIEELGAQKIYELFSYSLPHSVFVNEDNLVELPTIAVYYKKLQKQDLLFVAGDAQPIDEASSYKFSEAVLKMARSFNGAEVITLGGIGLPEVPKNPKVYCTGTSKDTVQKYSSGTALEPKLYGIVGPIMGVSGVLLGLAKKEKMAGVSLLAETYGHPMYLGIRGAREIVNILNKKLSLGINITELDNEIKQLETEAAKKSKLIGLGKAARGLKGQDATYIG